MDQVWSWITTLSSSSSSPSSLLLIASADKSILLRAETTAQELITFSISLMGFGPSKTLWASSAFPLSSLTPCHFLTQLVQEIITLSPTSSILPYDNSGPRLDVGPISYAINKAQESARFLFMLVLTCRLFWLCAVDAPAEAGFLFFRSVGPQSLGQALDCRPALRGVLTAVGPDWEERFMRSLGYVITKWCVLQELQQKPTAPMVPRLCPCYATSAQGLWILKGYAPTSAMTRISGGAVTAGRRLAIKDSALQYALAHQQLEAVIQMEYEVTMNDPRYIRVSTRVDNIRLHVVRLGLGRDDGDDERDDHLRDERHFPSRIRVWVGPEIGSSYTTGLSLGRSTYNPERELETTQTIKGNSATPKFPTVKARARTSVRSRWRSWRWEQEAEGSAAVFEGVLYDGMTGAEVAAAGGRGMRGRYTGVGRGFSKGGGLVVAGDEMGEGVSWRVGREMEGRVLKWRIGGRIWVSYCPNEVKSECFESRVVEWRDEVDLPLVASCN